MIDKPTNSRKKVKLKIEWSKLFSTAIALLFGIYGIWCGIKYYRLCELAITNCSILPDATLAVVCVTTVIGSLISYLLYQAGLKNSRNKYGVDSNGEPYSIKMKDQEENGSNISSTAISIPINDQTIQG